MRNPKSDFLVRSLTGKDRPVNTGLFRKYLYGVLRETHLIRAVVAVQKGEMRVSLRLMAQFCQSLVQPALRDKDTDICKDHGLSNRECEVLECLRKGYCNKDIARELYISEKTVKAHLGNIFKKLRVSQRLEAVIWAAKRKII